MSFEHSSYAYDQEVALLADYRLEVSRVCGPDKDNELTHKQRAAGIALAIAASEFLMMHSGVIADSPQSLKHNIVADIIPEYAENRIALDHLTGLPGRAQFAHDEQQALADESTSYIFFDANNFKSVNDTFGHPAGDRTLQLIAEVLSGTLEGREDSTAYRYGGDEFVVITKDDDPTTLMVSCEEAFERALNYPRLLDYGDGQSILTTQLAGLKLALVGGTGETSASADKSMYENKLAGKADSL